MTAYHGNVINVARYLEMVNMAYFMLHAFYYNKNI
jgi:hypothetical protein